MAVGPLGNACHVAITATTRSRRWWQRMADDLAARILDFARHHDAAVVSSAFLSRQLQVDVRTIAAALRRHDIRPRDVESVRGYVIAELAALSVEQAKAMASIGDAAAGAAVELRGVYSVVTAAAGRAGSAIEALSAGAGHDMTPALKAAGLL